MSKSQTVLVNADPRQRAWIEIQPAAIESNARILKDLIADSCLLMAVVKADGYGHGAQTVARAALLGGADTLGVATLQEGLELRQSGITCPILLLGNLINSEELAACLHSRLMPTISSSREALLCQKVAEDRGVKFRVHLKVDTGMTRLGCDLTKALALIQTIDRCNDVDLQGVYSHLALADDEFSSVTTKQYQRFEELLGSLKQKHHDLCFHLANSAGTLRDQAFHYDMVRVGLALYGYSPLKKFQGDLGLQPALSLKAKVTLVREVAKGVGVSYGHRFITKRSSRLAVVGIGYADGVSRALSGRLLVLINGRPLSQVGNITMDQLVLDVTDRLDVGPGSVVTLLGSDGKNCITPQQWSDWSGSIPWEVLCGFKNRLPRIVI
ncbi:alanine racemase [Prochlorococcus sp. MIT 1307]|uniref:alanine racemase n=1 Tax=Prochlorococcus sp. MIT 1307 TaxID=3096219 RepID=UPI002A747C6C|nr:alanine racemase [Prochlorococcus sp. MIT 1307]